MTSPWKTPLPQRANGLVLLSYSYLDEVQRSLWFWPRQASDCSKCQEESKWKDAVPVMMFLLQGPWLLRLACPHTEQNDTDFSRKGRCLKA